MLTVARAKDSVRLDPSSSAPVAKRSVNVFLLIYAILSSVYLHIDSIPYCVCVTTCCVCVLCVCVSQEGGFERQSAEPVDHFDGQYPKDRIIGTCNICRKTDVLVGGVCPHLLYSPLSPSQPNISFQCVACDERDQAILRQIRDNIHDIPCMKCSLRQLVILTVSPSSSLSPDLSLREIVIQMRCSCRHCMCLVCFRNLCRVKLDNNSFGNFEGFGYSVCCPGPGENDVNTALHHNDVICFPGLGADCKDVPILDPHHFKIVDENPTMDGTFVGPLPSFSFSFTPRIIYTLFTKTDIHFLCSTRSSKTNRLTTIVRPETTFCVSVRRRLPCRLLAPCRLNQSNNKRLSQLSLDKSQFDVKQLT